MNFTQAVQAVFGKYVTFSGRARRAEYWWFALFQFLCSVAFSILDNMIFSGQTMQTGPLEGLFSLAVFLPAISVMVRRLHDGNRSGWWFWIILIPLVGIIMLIYWLIKSGTEGPNDFGPDPISNSPAQHSTLDNTPLSPSDVPKVRRQPRP